MLELGTASSPAADYCLVYNYYSGVSLPTSCTAPSQASSGNNGNVFGYRYQDSVNTSLAHTEANTYDSLNRLATAAANNLSGGSLWSQTYTIDRYGNMTCSGTGYCTSMSYSATTNRLTAIGSATPTYDAAGDLLTDGSGTGTNTYTWDGESRLATATPYAQNTVTLTYNALGQRVRAASSSFTYDYAFSASGQELGLFNPGSGSWTNYEVNVAGRQMRLFASATRWLYHPSVLGSTSMMTDQTGAVQLDTTFYPWGQSWQTAGSNSYWTFAAFGPTQPGTSLYPTPFRHDSSTQGRWLSPDPLGGGPLNPQSLNRYAYALDNPCSLIDPLGLDACNFIINFNNQANLSATDITAIENQIEALFNASSEDQPNSVSVSFVTTGPADFTLTYNNNGVPGGPSGGGYLGANEETVYANLYPSSTYLEYTDRLLGVIGAHEIGHGSPGGIDDVAFSKKQGSTLMSIDTNPAWNTANNPAYSADFPAGLLFTPDQIAAMYKNCLKARHANGGAGGAGGGAGFGSSYNVTGTVTTCTTYIYWPNNEDSPTTWTECSGASVGPVTLKGVIF
jgi:RHS repeat-associated protein